MGRSIVAVSKLESAFYFAVWIGSVFYSIYNVYSTNTYFSDYHESYDDFSPGWEWLGGKRDTSDDEWRTWIPFMLNLVPWVLVHLIVGQIIKYAFNSTVLCSWYITVALLFLWSYVGALGTLCLLIQPSISCLLTALNSKVFLWIVNLSCLTIINLIKKSDVIAQEWLGIEEEQYYMLLIAMSWIQLRSISNGIESIEKYEHKDLVGFFRELLQNTAYCLYLPTLFLGPLILYSEFVNGVRAPYVRWNYTRLRTLVFNLARYTFWLYFTEFALHFVYFNALQYHPELVRELNPWAFYGMGYCMGQYFLNKYVVVYGIWGEIARAENIAATSHPKCIGRIHLYSDMWKHFDRGLYKFLVRVKAFIRFSWTRLADFIIIVFIFYRYIYVPVAGLKSPARKLLASSMCFGFVFLWHGTQLFIFIWSFMNFLGLTIEGTAKWIGNSKTYVRVQNKILGPRNIRRFNCALASPLLAMSAISNFYFFAGQEIGNIFVYRIFHDSWNVILLLLFSLYCCCHVSTDIKNYEVKKSLLIKDK